MQLRAFGTGLALVLLALAGPAPAGDAGDGAGDRLTPAAIDALLAERWNAAGLTPSGPCSDLDFLRRVTLDLTGTIPSLPETRAFAADPAPDKRARLVDRLLASRPFAQHWTDVLELAWLDRPTELQRSNRDQFRGWLEGRLAEGAGFDAIAREVLLAVGDQRDVGQAAYVIRYGGKAGDVAGAAARHFLGVQIQCAQCHNHPYEAWTTADFRDFAAFFGQTQMVPVRGPDPKDPTRQKRVSWAVEDGGRGTKAARVMGGMEGGDMGGGADGGMGGAEDEGGDLSPRQRRQRERRRAEMEKRLQELKEKNPERAQALEWATATPRALGETAAYDVGERSRREAFADWLTGPGRQRFARATANRLWAQCFGRGLVHPVDDFSPQHPATHPALLDRLATELARSGYSLRDFLRLLTSTRAYQLASVPSADNAGDTELYARAYVRQLTPEQAYASLFQATTGADPGTADERRRRFILRARESFIDAFVVELGNEEGDTVDAFQGSIPAALALLNGGLSNGAEPDAGGKRAGKGRTRGRGRDRGRGAAAAGADTVDQIVAAHADPAERVRSLYLAALVREPSAAELERCTTYVAEAPDPVEGCEDLLWALVNSTEFLVAR
jgi:hypothetical protein